MKQPHHLRQKIARSKEHESVSWEWGLPHLSRRVHWSVVIVCYRLLANVSSGVCGGLADAREFDLPHVLGFY